MALSPELAAALADKPTLLEEAKSLDAKAEKLTPDVEAALPKLSGLAGLEQAKASLDKILGETKAKDPDGLLTDWKNIKAVKEDLERQKNDWKKGSGGGGGDVTQSPEYKALEEKLTTALAEFNTKVKALEDESKAAKETAATSASEKRETDLKASIIGAAAKHKIRDAEDEYLLLKAKGLIGYAEKDGKYSQFFHKLNEKGEKVAVASADELLAHIAATNKAKVDPSGKSGTGGDHKGDGGKVDGPTTASQARAAFIQK